MRDKQVALVTGANRGAGYEFPQSIYTTVNDPTNREWIKDYAMTLLSRKNLLWENGSSKLTFAVDPN